MSPQPVRFDDGSYLALLRHKFRRHASLIQGRTALDFPDCGLTPRSCGKKECKAERPIALRRLFGRILRNSRIHRPQFVQMPR